MPTHILDASALLALLNKEPGGERVRELLRTGGVGMSVLNLSEVAAKLIARGGESKAIVRLCQSQALELVAVDAGIAFTAASLVPATHALGLSLGDRVCLATAQQLHIPAVTADRAWEAMPGCMVELIR